MAEKASTVHVHWVFFNPTLTPTRRSMLMSLAESYTRNVISFQKAAFENSFSMVSVMQEVAARSIQAGISRFPWMPDEGKEMVEQFCETLKEGRETFRQAVCDGYDQIADALGQRIGAASFQLTESARQMTREAEHVGQRMSEVSRGSVRGAAEMVEEIMRTAQSEGGARKEEPQEPSEEAKSSEPRSDKKKSGKLRLNDTSREELASLFGIGEATAEKVVGFIKKKGPISDWDELEKIPGIRNSIISRLKEECRL
jgi:DNA uptake protein ComE-like DNA-binding protein